MKHFAFLIALFFAGQAFSQGPTCCAKEDKATATFAAFADDMAFRNMHPEPKSLNAAEQKGEMVQFDAADGQGSQAYFLSGAKDSKSCLFVIHEWWGLNDQVKAEADRLHEELGGEVHVMALDMYDGAVATTREAASKLMQGVEGEHARAIIRGAAASEYLSEGTKIGTIGWCFGGGWSLQASMELGEQAAGCVMYYGMPEEDEERLGGLTVDVLGIFAAQDGWITPEVVEQFEERMENVGKNLTYKIFDAKHAFANPTRDVYDDKAATEANAMALEFLKERLQ